MKDNIPKQNINPAMFNHAQNQMPRVATRMEGSKNHSSRPVKKAGKSG
jgi:hypothetical protein